MSKKYCLIRTLQETSASRTAVLRQRCNQCIQTEYLVRLARPFMVAMLWWYTVLIIFTFRLQYNSSELQ